MLDEICNFSVSKNKDKVATELDELIAKKIICKIDEFYLSDYDLDSIEKRKSGNKMAVEALKKAKEKAQFIAKFPFVEAVGVSGSLSKGYYDKDSDIDFFVITSVNKVWLCRSFLMLYKKLFLFNSRKYFCVNYFVSAGNLEIEEKNRFTATEIKTLIPFTGRTAFVEFYKQNNWIVDIFGQFTPKLESVKNVKKPIPTQLSEQIFQTVFGNAVDNVLKRVTVYFWKIKFRQMSREEFKIALKSTTNISKHHPQNFQKQVLTSLNQKYDEIKRKHNIELPKEYV